MASEEKTRSSRFLRRATEVIWPFGAFQKTTDPHKAIENLERASASATLWILGGILIEIAALFVFSHEWPERIVGVIANGAIGLGLAVEYVVIGKVIDATKEAERESNERVAKIEERAVQLEKDTEEARAGIAKANADVAKANAQAATATAEQARLKAQIAWRALPTPIAAELVRRLSLQPGKINVQHVANDPEALYFAIQIANIFTNAKWEVRTEAHTFGSTLVLGLFIPDCPNANPSFVRNAFAAASIGFAQQKLLPPMMTHGFRFNDAPIVFIGSKPFPSTSG